MKKLRKYFAGKGKAVGIVVSLIPALFALILGLYFIWGPGEGYLHADWTDSIYWANATVESGEIFDPEFRYAGMLPFSVSALFVPLIQMFGVGMAAQNIGMTMILIIYLGGIVFLCSSAKLDWGWSSIAAFVSLMAMSGSDKLREMMYGHNLYYTLGPIILFYGLGFLLRAFRDLNEEGRKTRLLKIRTALWFAAFFLLSIGTGTDNVQVIAIGTLPACAGLFAERFFSGEEKLISKKNRILPIMIGAFVIGSVLGILLWNGWRGELESGYANGYSGWSEVSKWHENAGAFFRQYFTLIGVNPSGILFSFESVIQMVRLAGGIVLLIVPAVMFVFYRKLSGTAVRAMLWSHTVVVFVVLFGFIFGKLSGVNWRLTPILASAGVLSVFAVRELFLHLPKPNAKAGAEEESAEDRKAGKGNVPVRIGWLLFAILIAASFTVAVEIMRMPSGYGRDNTLHQLTEYLVEKRLEYGYATFWQSQSITVLSDSKVRCRMVNTNDKDGVYSDFYQSSRRWYREHGHDRYFILLSDGEYRSVSKAASWKDWTDRCLREEYGPADGLPDGFRLFVFSENVLNGK